MCGMPRYASRHALVANTRSLIQHVPGNKEHLQFARCVWLRPKVPAPCIDEPRAHHYGDQSAGCTGKVFLDGSAYCPAVPALRRAGWSIVKLTADGAVLRAAYGPLPLMPQSVPAAEHWALKMLVKLGAPPWHAITDCKYVYDSFHADKGASVGPRHCFADMEGGRFAKGRDVVLEGPRPIVIPAVPAARSACFVVVGEPLG